MKPTRPNIRLNMNVLMKVLMKHLGWKEPVQLLVYTVDNGIKYQIVKEELKVQIL